MPIIGDMSPARLPPDTPPPPQELALDQCYLLLNHGPTTLVTSAAGERRNIMAAAWAMPLDFDPPKILLVVDRSTLTRELIEATGEFALNLPCRAFAAQTVAVGSISGRTIDKFAEYRIETFAAARIGAPLVAGCVAWLECRVISEPRNQQAYDLFIAEVVHARADPRVFAEGRWRECVPALRTIHYQAGGRFFATGEAFDV